MSADSYLIAIISLIVITAILTLLFLMRAEHERVITLLIIKRGEAEVSWREERQQLLDRIQSPTFSEYKHQEVKVIKAKNGTDKPDIVIEQL